jgi:hypothetical protein
MIRKFKTYSSLSLVVVFVALAILAFGWGAARAVENAQGVPIIEIDEPTYDFKEVSQGETVKHVFKVLNKGTAPLEIKGVKPG